MKPPNFPRLAMIMAAVFAAFHLFYAGILFCARSDTAKVARIETPRQFCPFALDLVLVGGIYAVGLFGVRMRKYVADEALIPALDSKRRQYGILCLCLAVFLALLTWRTYQAPLIGNVMRRHVFMALIFLLLGIYNLRHFSLTKEEEKRYAP